MKKISRILSYTLPLLAAFTFLFSFNEIWEYIKDFSHDGEIKPSTRDYYETLFNRGRLVLFILSTLPLMYILLFNRIALLLNKFVNIFIKTIKSINNSISINKLFITAFIISIVFMISAVFLFDIGQDPAYYLNDIQNIEKFGFIARDYDTGGINIYLIPNLPFNILSYAYVKLFGFSVIGIRFIIVLFSFLFIYSLYLFLDREIFKYSFILIFSIPGIYSLTSEIFLEIPALSFIFLSLYYLNKFESIKKRKFEYYAIFYLTLAFATKFQMFVYIILVFGFMILFETEIERKRFLLFFLIKTYLSIFFIVIATIIPFGLKETLIYLNWYFIDAAREGRSFLRTADIKLFMLNEILFIPLLIFIIYLFYKMSDNKNKLYSTDFIPAFSILNSLYWLVIIGSVTWRNAIYANVFLFVMLSSVLIKSKNYSKIVLSTFFLVGLLSNIIFLNHGVIDDIQYHREHFKRIQISRDETQREFFSNVKSIIEPFAKVYTPGVPYLSRVYLHNRRVMFYEDFDPSDTTKSYLIYDKEAYGETQFDEVQEKVLMGHYKNVHSVGDYHLYEIIKAE